MSDWNKFWRGIRKVRDIAFADVLTALPRLTLGELIRLLPQVEDAIRKATPPDREILHEGDE